MNDNDPEWNTFFNFGSIEFGHELIFEVWDSDVKFDDFVGDVCSDLKMELVHTAVRYREASFISPTTLLVMLTWQPPGVEHIHHKRKTYIVRNVSAHYLYIIKNSAFMKNRLHLQYSHFLINTGQALKGWRPFL